MLGSEEQPSVAHLVKLSERFSGRRVPILAVSGLPLGREKCAQIGVDDCLTKPYKLEDLIDKLELLLGPDLLIRVRIKAS